MSHKHHNNNPFKNSENIVEDSKKETPDKEAEVEVDEQSNSEIDELQKKYDALNQQYIRLAADFDNYRKRQEHEREELLKFGTENALKKMIEVLDNFERGKKALENVEDCEKCKESFNLIHKELTLRTRPNNAHLPFQHIPKLWQLIQMVSPQETSDFSQPLVIFLT